MNMVGQWWIGGEIVDDGVPHAKRALDLGLWDFVVTPSDYEGDFGSLEGSWQIFVMDVHSLVDSLDGLCDAATGV